MGLRKAVFGLVKSDLKPVMHFSAKCKGFNLKTILEIIRHVKQFKY